MGHKQIIGFWLLIYYSNDIWLGELDYWYVLNNYTIAIWNYSSNKSNKSFDSNKAFHCNAILSIVIHCHILSEFYIISLCIRLFSKILVDGSEIYKLIDMLYIASHFSDQFYFWSTESKKLFSQNLFDFNNYV